MVARPKLGRRNAGGVIKSGSSSWKKLSANEIRLAKRWYDKDGVKPSELAERLGRDKPNTAWLLVKQEERRPQGCPVYLRSAEVGFPEQRLHELIVKADKRYEVTVAMLQRSTRTEACERSILNA